jgi:hypothetical protein
MTSPGRREDMAQEIGLGHIKTRLKEPTVTLTMI